MTTIEDQVFENIKSGKVKMKPRWYFILQTTLAIVAGTVLFVAIVFLTIFITFIQRQTATSSAISYGLAGWVIFFQALPWTLIITAIIFIVLLAILAQRYAFVYQRPLIYALMVIAGLAVILTVIIAATPLYSLIFGGMPGPGQFFINGIYRYETQPISSLHRGEVTLVANNGFLLQNDVGETSTVLFAPGVPYSAADYKAGDQVVVFGARGQNGIIEAFGVQKL